MSYYQSTKVIELGSCAFRQWKADPQLATAGLVRDGNSCYKVHGYQLKAKFTFGCKELDERNWAVDYGSLKRLKATLNEQFDHTLTIDQADPCLELFKQLHEARACNLKIMNGVGIEKVAEYCFNEADKFLKEEYGDRCWVESVEVFEHEANSSIFKR
jgi:6-pyruvoyltetrahydropterin/6-carboxytetrahydropterin synthase